MEREIKNLNEWILTEKNAKIEGYAALERKLNEKHEMEKILQD